MNVKKNTSNLTSSKKQYDSFRKYFPFSCADLILFENDSILLTNRTQNPYKGMWHLPGTMIRRGEKVEEAIKRAGEVELGLKVSIIQYVGFFESIDSFRHDISHGFIIKTEKSQIKTDYQSNDHKFFKRLPKNLVPHHKMMIKSAKKIKGFKNLKC